MKKGIIIVCIIVFFCLLFNKSDEQIRIRVIANSDSVEDQLKKKEVVYYLYSNYNLDFSSIEECDSYLNSNIEVMKSDLYSKFDNIKVSYETHNFSNKTYNNIVRKSNCYKTLLIEIEEAKGENFWGILYSDEFYEDEDTVKYKSYLVELFKKGERNV